MTYSSLWWSVELPPGWQLQVDDICTTFTASHSDAALQVSAACKDAGTVTDEELLEFAVERLPTGVTIETVGWGAFSGFSAIYQKEGRSWQECWLRHQELMVYLTYNSSSADARLEEEVARILATLKKTR